MEHYTFSDLQQNPGHYIFRPLENLNIDGEELRNSEMYDIVSVTRDCVCITFDYVFLGANQRVEVRVPGSIAFDEKKVYIHQDLQLMIEDTCFEASSGTEPIGIVDDERPLKELVIPDFIDEVFLD